MIDETWWLRTRIRRAAGNLAIEHHAAGTTPEGTTIKDHAFTIETDALQEVNMMNALGGMAWTEAAERVVEALEQLAAEKGKV